MRTQDSDTVASDGDPKPQTGNLVAENLAQLMYSVMMTGYMFGNAQYRLELQQSLEHIALPDPEEKMRFQILHLGHRKRWLEKLLGGTRSLALKKWMQ